MEWTQFVVKSEDFLSVFDKISYAMEELSKNKSKKNNEIFKNLSDAAKILTKIKAEKMGE